MKCPYGKLELTIALINAAKKLEAYVTKAANEQALQNKIEARIGKVSGSVSSTKDIADYHGITVEQLVNSNNYVVLCQQYGEHIIRETINIIRDELGVNDKEAWAIFMVDTLEN